MAIDPKAPAPMQAPTDVLFEGVHCKLRLSLRRGNICVAKISGHDVGEFGDKPLKVLSNYLAERGSLKLFVDAREVPGASTDVSSLWAEWLRRNRELLPEVHLLSGSRFIHLTATFVRQFVGLEDRMWVYTEAESFETALAKAR